MAEKKKGIVKADLTRACIHTALIAFFIICTASLALANGPSITVTPSNFTPGDLVTLNGTEFKANENITLTTTVTCWKPVVDGQCECDMEDFEILPGVRFDLSVREVKDHVSVYIKKGIWLPIGPGTPGFTFVYNAATKTSNVSSVKIPTGGRYSIDVIGDAVDGAKNCTMTTTATLIIQADGSGAFSQVFDTTGIPICCMRVTATGETSDPCTVDLQLCLKGDASKDGHVNAYDCCCIARYCCEIPGYDNCTICCTSADVDGTSGVTGDDARYLARYLVGLEDELH